MAKITKDMLIAEVVDLYPDVAELFLQYGLACVGCMISEYETIEEGARSHGMDDETLELLLRDANELISDEDVKQLLE